ncbi:MAG TPA: hypothetical protein VK886_11470 [Vicinamibacterales bacterium]|nr:hypothetical protein [Vicinamibacterales bacterium]
MRTRVVVVAAAVVTVAWASLAQAQVNATMVMRSGEKFTGQLVDLGGIGLTFRYGGVERQYRPGDIAVIEFEGAPPRALSQEELRHLNDGQHVIIFRDGRVVVGHFVDLGERDPLRVTVATESAQSNYHSNEIWRIYMAPPPASYTSGVTTPGTTASTAQPAPPGAIVVAGNQQWTPTGLIVRRGETIRFSATGHVQLSGDSNDRAQPAGAFSGRKTPGSPMPEAITGALIARIGEGKPFGIGDLPSVQMPESGPLHLGINDDYVGDNTGQFNVQVTRARGRR